MAITDYASLKTEVATWLQRVDQTNNIDTFIDNAEAWFNRTLRLREMETESTTLTISATGVISHPSDWLAWKDIQITSAPLKHIDVVTEETANIGREFNTTGRPTKAVIRGTGTLLKPVPDSTSYAYLFVYFQKIPPLSATTNFTTNWLLLSHSDLYLYATLWQACVMIQDLTQAEAWRIPTMLIVDQLKLNTKLDGRSGGSLMPRVRRIV